MQQEKSSMTTERERPAQLTARHGCTHLQFKNRRAPHPDEVGKRVREATTTRFNNQKHVYSKGKSGQTVTKRQVTKPWRPDDLCDTHDIGIDDRFLCKTPPDTWNTKNKCEQN